MAYQRIFLIMRCYGMQEAALVGSVKRKLQAIHLLGFLASPGSARRAMRATCIALNYGWI